MRFAEWEAAVAAGATLDELYKLESGGYPKWFRAALIAWHNVHEKVRMVKEDAAARASERAGKH